VVIRNCCLSHFETLTEQRFVLPHIIGVIVSYLLVLRLCVILLSRKLADNDVPLKDNYIFNFAVVIVSL